MCCVEIVLNRTSRSAALPYPEHGCQRMPAPMRSPCTYIYIDLLNFVFLRDCPSLASQSSNFHITCGTFPAFLCFPASFEIRNANTSTYRYYYRFVHTIRYYAVGSHARPAQISPAIYSPAAERSAVRSRAVRCRALRCGPVSLRCVLSFEHRAVPGIMRVVVYQVRSTTFPLLSFSACI